MSGFLKVLTGILGVLAVIACLATIGIVGYSMIGGGGNKNIQTAQTGEQSPLPEAATPTQTPETTAEPDPAQTPEPITTPAIDPDHVHDYEESVEKKANCYQPGKIKYTCSECGDTYYVDVMSTGHVAGDWEVSRKPTEEREGLRVKKCIYCDEIVAQESIQFKKEAGSSQEEEEEKAPHIHQYTASTEREPSCTLAGLRKYSCSCGNFYTEMIPAPGHIATDWEVAAEATTTKMGTEQRTCSVCGVVLDSRPINMLTPSPSTAPTQTPAQTQAPSPAQSPAASGAPTAAPTAAPTPSAAPTPTPHVHDYKSYILKEANCTEKGIRSFSCVCGSSYAEPIELDLNRHTFRSVVIPATAHTQGYTVYTCVRCNYSYFDNYTPAIGN